MNEKGSSNSKRTMLYKQKRGRFNASVAVFKEKSSSSIKVGGRVVDGTQLSCNLIRYIFKMNIIILFGISLIIN